MQIYRKVFKKSEFLSWYVFLAAPCISVCLCVSVVCEWSTREVCSWLRDLDLVEHCDAFVAHDIRGRELLTLGRTDLKVSINFFCCQNYVSPVRAPGGVRAFNQKIFINRLIEQDVD